MMLSQLLKNVICYNEYDEQTEIIDLAYDSRKVIPGCAFICLVGFTTDGHNFAKQAEEQGSAVIIAQKELDVTIPVIIVADTRLALAQMSAAYFDHPAQKLKIIGITGTKGKTTTSYMIYSILKTAGYQVGVIGTIGILIGDKLIESVNTTPESYEVQSAFYQMVEAGCKVVAIEASSIGLRDHRLSGFTFDIGLFTNFSEDHIGPNEHKSIEEYLASKNILFHQCKLGIINIDDPNWKDIIKDHTCYLETYGFNKEATLSASNQTLISRPSFLGMKFKVEGAMNFILKIDMPGKFNVYNALAAITTCRHFQVTQKDIQNGLSNIYVKGRIEIVPVSFPYTLLIDYAHNAVSMKSILETLLEYKPNRLICLFGAGGNRSRVRRYEMGEVSGNLADLSIITADNSRFEDILNIIEDIKKGMNKTKGEYKVISDRKEAIRFCIENAQEGDIIVLAGKGQERYQEIQGIKYPFDERVIIEEILREKNKG